VTLTLFTKTQDIASNYSKTGTETWSDCGRISSHSSVSREQLASSLAGISGATQFHHIYLCILFIYLFNNSIKRNRMTANVVREQVDHKAQSGARSSLTAGHQ